jgi:hypothetical protein
MWMNELCERAEKVDSLFYVSNFPEIMNIHHIHELIQNLSVLYLGKTMHNGWWRRMKLSQWMKRMEQPLKMNVHNFFPRKALRGIYIVRRSVIMSTEKLSV